MENSTWSSSYKQEKENIIKKKNFVLKNLIIKMNWTIFSANTTKQIPEETENHNSFKYFLNESIIFKNPQKNSWPRCFPYWILADI